MLKVILQKGQGMVEEGGRWAVSVRRRAVSRSAGAKNGFPDGGRAFDTVRWGSRPPESSGKCEPLCV